MAITSKNHPESDDSAKFRKWKTYCAVLWARRSAPEAVVTGGQQVKRVRGDASNRCSWRTYLDRSLRLSGKRTRIIGGRQCNKDKIWSVRSDLQVIKREKPALRWSSAIISGWEKAVTDSLLITFGRVKTSDSKQVIPASKRLIEEHSLPVTHVWGDRGLHSAQNEQALAQRGVYSGLCPRDIDTFQQSSKTIPSYALA